jgi:Xaa-Pro aminopeptidase
MRAETTHQIRRARAAGLLDEAKVDALLITSLHNVRYLTGFTGSNGALLLFRDGRAILVTDPRYTVQSREQVDCEVRIAAKPPLVSAGLRDLGRRAPRRLGFERETMTVAQFDALEKGLPARTKLAPVTGLIERLRMVKDADEIAHIRASVVSNSRALEAALRLFKPGMTESELAAEIDYRNRKFGAEAPAFDTIVAAGARAALPHAQPGNAKVGPGMLLIDMGAFREGYASDMTRMAHVGPPTPKYKRAYRAVLEAHLAAADAVKPGAAAVAVDRAARRVLKTYGLDREFIHSTGHGLGLEIHEPPRLGRRDNTKLEAGMAVTIEPGVYIEGWGGIRIEDTILVTPNGYEVLTPTTKDLREI